jgi:hypothetical protein
MAERDRVRPHDARRSGPTRPRSATRGLLLPFGSLLLAKPVKALGEQLRGLEKRGHA